MSKAARKADDLGLDLSQDALDALEDIAFPEASELLDQVHGKGSSIRNPSAYIMRTIEHGFESGKGGGGDRDDSRGKGGGSRSGGRRAARAEELGLDLEETAFEALNEVPFGEAMNILEDLHGKGDAVRNPSGWVISACRKLTPGGGKGPTPAGRPSGRGSRSAQRAEELGLHLDDECLAALRSIEIQEAMQLLDDCVAKRIRNPSSYVVAACRNIQSGHPRGGGKSEAKGGGKGPGGKGGKSAARAADLGLELDEAALDALASVPLGEAYNLLDDVHARGVGKGGIRNPNNYIVSSCAKISGLPPAREQSWEEPRPSRAIGSAPPRMALPPAHSLATPGNKSADRAAEHGIELTEEAQAALGSIPLRDALDLLDEMAVKGGKIRNQPAYIVSTVAKMAKGGKGEPRRAAASEPYPTSSKGAKGGASKGGKGGKGGGKGSSAATGVEARVLELNRQGLWESQIDVEALVILKSLAPSHAHELLDSLEAKGRSGKGAIRNPSNYIGAAAARSKGDRGGGGGKDEGRKRPRPADHEARYDHGPRGGRGGAVESRAQEMSLTGEAINALERQHEDDAMQLLDQVVDNMDKIKNVSKYIVGACARGLDFSRERPSKRPRRD